MSDKLLSCLQDLHERLVSNYNDNTPFEQLEEDRLAVSNAIELLEKQIPKKPNIHGFREGREINTISFTCPKRTENACERLNQRVTNYLFSVNEMVGENL